MTTPSLTPRQQELLHELFKNLPRDFEQRKTKVLQIKQAFQQELANSIQDSLNDFLSKQPQETLEQKRELAYLTNHLLRELGLSILSPNGKKSTLVLYCVRAGHPENTRYRLLTHDEHGKKISKELYCKTIPTPFTFVPADTRWEGLSKYKPDSPGPTIG